MRRRRMWIVLLLALVSGLAAATLMLKVLRRPTSPIARATASTEVLVAERDLPVGSLVTVEDMKKVDWPGDALPEGYSSNSEELVGRGVITPIHMNEPLLSSKLALPEAGGGLPIIIPEGMRAVSVRVDEVIGVAGFVLPSTRVDVVVTIDQGTESDATVTKIVLQNVAVLASGQIIQKDAEGKPQTVTVITLMVTPEQAEKLILSATKGQIQLALRNTLDLDTLTTPGVRVSGLAPSRRVVRRAPVRSRRVARPAAAVEVFRGPKRSTTPVESEGGSR